MSDATESDADGTTAAPERPQSPLARRTRTFVRRFRRNRLAMGGLVVTAGFVLLALLAPVLAPYDPAAVDVPARLQGPSPAHPFGTDRYGRDLFSRVLFGARIALQVAVATPLVAGAVGVPIGLVAGYVGGRVDDVLMRLMDSVFAFPAILLGLTLVAVFGQSLTNIVVALGIVYVPQFARVTRGSAVSVVEEEHVRVARSLGASHARIVLVHVLPFCLSAILVQATVTAALAIVLESSLSFLGVGVPSPTPSWGSILRVGKGYVDSGEWWYSVFPGVAIVIAVLGFNLLGDGLRDVLDPRTDPNR
ncbi:MULTISPECIES: ABC transporter permease [Halolamina]|uniref:Peptide/nickel transport system permease protein n=1 Tax=Halolamina pelagica TaxID=699431 RepID=A0A1I5QBC5_9EURY|nr:MULTISPECIES: ABC transporter permease [Halolamina]NHX35171.1 ABC transporter permease [Halolamina sp. R1-12]SFP43136.1 peptide/nickel transport system permease protein [Halolamina pelagica]